jgi:hypothetical protein
MTAAIHMAEVDRQAIPTRIDRFCALSAMIACLSG